MKNVLLDDVPEMACLFLMQYSEAMLPEERQGIVRESCKMNALYVLI